MSSDYHTSYDEIFLSLKTVFLDKNDLKSKMEYAVIYI